MTEEQQQYLSGYIEGAADGGDSKFGKDMESVVRMVEDTLRGKDWGFEVFYEIKITVKRED